MVKRLALISCGFLAALSAPQRAGAQSYELTWATVDGGGVMSSSGGGFSLGGTIGQADASGALAGGAYTLRGGFWAVVAPERTLRFFRASTDGARPPAPRVEPHARSEPLSTRVSAEAVAVQAATDP